jgi:hypothetical protein
VSSATDTPYELVVRSRTGAEECCGDSAPLPRSRRLYSATAKQVGRLLYKPQEYKKRLAVHAWIPEARVPPYSPEHDDLPINERYDVLKFFERDGEEVECRARDGGLGDL